VTAKNDYTQLLHQSLKEAAKIRQGMKAARSTTPEALDVTKEQSSILAARQ
jgi:hypothetical protein